MRVVVENAPETFKYFTYAEFLEYWPNHKGEDTNERLLTSAFELHNAQMDVIVFVDLGYTANGYLAYKTPDSDTYNMAQFSGALGRVKILKDLGFAHIAILGFIDRSHLPSSKLDLYVLNKVVE